MGLMLTEDDIKDYHILKDEKEDEIDLTELGNILKYKWYLRMEYTRVEQVAEALSFLVKAKFYDRTPYHELNGSLDYTILGYYSWNKYEYINGKTNVLINVTPNEMYDFYTYYIQRKVSDLGNMNGKEFKGVGIWAGYDNRLERFKDSYRRYGKRLYENVVYYCGHAKAYKIVKEYDELYFKVIEGTYNKKYSKADKILLRTLYNARLWRLDKRYKILGKEKRYKIYKG